MIVHSLLVYSAPAAKLLGSDVSTRKFRSNGLCLLRSNNDLVILLEWAQGGDLKKLIRKVVKRLLITAAGVP